MHLLPLPGRPGNLPNRMAMANQLIDFQGIF